MELTEAQQLIADHKKQAEESAVKEFNELMAAWSKKHNATARPLVRITGENTFTVDLIITVN